MFFKILVHNDSQRRRGTQFGKVNVLRYGEAAQGKVQLPVRVQLSAVQGRNSWHCMFSSLFEARCSRASLLYWSRLLGLWTHASECYQFEMAGTASPRHKNKWGNGIVGEQRGVWLLGMQSYKGISRANSIGDNKAFLKAATLGAAARSFALCHAPPPFVSATACPHPYAQPPFMGKWEWRPPRFLEPWREPTKKARGRVHPRVRSVSAECIPLEGP